VQGFLMIPYRIMLPTLFPLFIMLRKIHILPCARSLLCFKLCCCSTSRTPVTDTGHHESSRLEQDCATPHRALR
jgi:hypothetical protein